MDYLGDQISHFLSSKDIHMLMATSKYIRCRIEYLLPKAIELEKNNKQIKEAIYGKRKSLLQQLPKDLKIEIMGIFPTNIHELTIGQERCKSIPNNITQLPLAYLRNCDIKLIR